MPDAAALLDQGAAGLAVGDWVSARTAYSGALAAEPTAEAWFGLGSARWWLGEVVEALHAWEQAYAGFLRRSDPAQAAEVAINLSLVHNANAGNRALSAGWAARAARAAEISGVPQLSAWARLAHGATCEDPAQVDAWAEEACAVARATGDRDLELCALSQRGSALVDAGRVAEGTALLDEALAGSLGGEATSLDTVVFTSCTLMQSCYRSADFLRIVSWAGPLDSFIERYGCPYVSATCRAHYGALLVATGDWRRAEEELAVALHLAGGALRGVRAEAAAFLAELRLGQGRVDEARRIVAPYEELPVVVPVLAAVQLAAGEVAAAITTAQRRLAVAGTRQLEEARLREVVGEALLTTGEVAAAADEGRRLVALGAASDADLVMARGARLLGRALGASGDAAGACARLDAARTTFGRLEMPFEVARTRLSWAETQHGTEPEVALAEARAALVTFDDLGAARDADAAAAWLRAAGARVSRGGPRGVSLITRREREVLELLGAGRSNPEIAERLYLSRRTVEHHVASILSKLGLRSRAEVAALVAGIDRSGPGTS